MRTLRSALSLLLPAALLLLGGCNDSGNLGVPGTDDDDAIQNPGPLDVPHTNGPKELLPDLTVDAFLLTDSISFGVETPTGLPSDCEVIEGCLVDGQGPRQVLRFDVGVVNLGQIDLVLGDPSDHPEDYEYSACHGHMHHKGFADYRLSDATGVLATGRKQAFCLMDIEDYQNDGDSARYYDCGNQGISMGWEDVYDKGLDCQFIDITDVSAGNYTLSVTVNADHRIPESGPEPNTVSVPVSIP